MDPNKVCMTDILQERIDAGGLVDDSIQEEQRIGEEIIEAIKKYKKAQAEMVARLNITGYRFEYGSMKPMGITTAEKFCQGLEPVVSLKAEVGTLQLQAKTQNSITWWLKDKKSGIEKDIEAIRRGM